MKRHVFAMALIGGLLAGSAAACGGDPEPVGNRAGVTSEPCPKAVDRSKGCVYLGVISDLSAGPRSAEAVAITEAQQKFWDRVNRAGGIGGYEIDAVTYVRDNKASALTHASAYRDIRGKVLALAQTTGSDGTAAILSDLRADRVVAAPASSTSAWSFEPLVLKSGANYCVEGMNAVDYAGPVGSIMSIHLTGDYGDDSAAGVKFGATANSIRFINIKTDPGAERQDGAAGQILAQKPDVVILSTGPAETEAIVRKAAEGGYRGKIIGAGPSWDASLLRGPAAPALRDLYVRIAPWGPWNADTPGHRTMREALGSLAPQDGHVTGWILSYPLKAALESAAARDDMTHSGLAAAARDLKDVDYEGMLPRGRTNESMVLSPATGTGVLDVPVVRGFFAGPTVGRTELDRPCFQDL